MCGKFAAHLRGFYLAFLMGCEVILLYNRQSSPIANRQSRARSHLSFPFLNVRGFSIVGVLVAAGMMGGLALYLANIAKQQHVTQRKAETGTEITQIQHKILSVFYDGDACTKTLVLPAPHNRLANGRVIDELKNRQGTVVVKKGVPINRLLQVEQMVLRNVQTTGKTREADIVITMKKLGVANAGATTVKTFKITAEMESATSNVISRCHHTLDAKEHGIKSRMCTEMGGVMVCPNGQPPTLVNGVPTCTGGVTITRCSIGNLFERFCSSMGGTWNSGNCSITPVTTPIYTSITTISSALQAELAKKVNKAGDTMTGDLSVPNLSASGRVSASGPAGTSGTPTTGGTPAPASCPYPQTGTPPNCVNPSCPPGYSRTVCSVHPGHGSTVCDRQFVGGAWCYTCGRWDCYGDHFCDGYMLYCN